METLKEAIDRIGLSIRSEFVPFSKSRNAGEKHKSLNWKVTLVYKDKDILTTDYSAGIAHCPAYKTSVSKLGHKNSLMRSEFIDWKIENGKDSLSHKYSRIYSGKPILPNTADVIYSLVMDCDVIEYPTFEDWAETFGYDTDSRKAETIYRSCLEIALKLRNGLGESNLAALREAASEY